MLDVSASEGASGQPARPPLAASLALAGVASLGAGAIHAAAVGVHSEHRSAVVAFSLIAGAQLAWGGAALARRGRALAAAGIAVQVVALAGWVRAKTSGIDLIAGLEEAESVQLADGAAAGLAAAAVLLAVRALLLPALPDGPRPRRLAAPASGAVALGVTVLTVFSMVAAGSHTHAGGHGHGDETAAHAHGAEADHHDTEETAAGADHHADGAAPHEDHVAVPVRAYDPTLPIDLGGVEGVTPQQQAAAENLIALTLARLPQFADAAAAEAAGFKSIGDGITGHEHLIRWDYLSDGRILDPDHPEALVYDTSGNGRTLVSAMFMLEPGSTLDTVPELGGALTQWHIHDDLCFTSGDAPRVVGITRVGGECQPPLQKFTPVPMIHVWITPHRCGPFAALEGVGAGQIAEGEERLCDHAHGAGT